MYIDLNTDEIINLLENGSTNQKNFINLCRKYAANMAHTMTLSKQ